MPSLKKYQIHIAFAVIIVFFLISRLPFFLYFPVPGGFVSDAFEYFDVALQMESGHTPIFDIRTPGYPAFLFLISKFFGNLFSLLIIQNLITLAAALFLTYSVYRNYRKLTYGAAAAVIFYFMSNNSVEADTNVLTNSLYTNLLIMFLAFLIFALNKNKCWIWLSLTIAATIYVRPSGIFLGPIVVFILIFLQRKGWYRNAWLKLLAPAGVMLLGLCFYNFVTLGKFSLSPWGGMNLAGATMTFLDTDSSFTECENRAVIEVRKSISDADRAILKSKGNLDKKHELYFDNYYLIIPFYRNLLSKCGYSNYVEALPSLKKVSTTAIRKEPGMYLQFVTTNFYYYIVDGNLHEHQLFYYSEVKRRYTNIYIKKRPQKDDFFSFTVPDTIPVPLKKYGYKEFYGAKDGLGLEKRQAELKQNFAFKLYDLYTLKFNRVFLRNWFWPVALVFLFLFSGIKLLVNGFSDKNALLILVICCINIGSAMLVSLVEVSFYHYTYMTEFVYYLAVALSPILFKKFVTE